jgi:hypothetical protein
MFIERSLIRSARRLARRLFRVRPGGAGRRSGRLDPVTELHPDAGGTRLIVRVGNLSLSCLISGSALCRSVACPADWLAACEGAGGQVELTVAEHELELSWQADAIPQSLRVPLSTATSPPATPKLTEVDPRLLTALATAGTAADHQARRIRLARSMQVGQPTHRAMNRAYLRRAAQLGLTELLCYGPGEPLVGRGDRLLYLWQPLGGVDPPLDDDQTLRIDSAASGSSLPVPPTRRASR